MRRPIFTISVLLGVLLASCSKRQGEVVRVTIPQGASVMAVAESLAGHRVITSPRGFRTYLRITGQDRSIRAGVFDFREGMSSREAAQVLLSGPVALARLVLPEGLMLTEIATTVEQQLEIPPDRLLAAARDSSLLTHVGARGETLEGYLYPSTYLVRVDATAEQVVQQLVKEFDNQWKLQWNARLDSLGLSRDELITLASIIEGEVRHQPDRWYVSSVYHNRLKRGMRLQADPTVIYAIGERRRLFQRDYEVASPYNTYRIAGLPKHPIGQPSAASIEAALYPRPSDFLYFVAGADGNHVFSRSYREHLANIRAIRGR